MKKIILSLLILCPYAIFAQSNFTVSGKISGPLSTVKEVYLSYNNGEKYLPSDSAEVKNGRFELSGTMLTDDYNPAKITIARSRSLIKVNEQLTLFVKKGDNITIDVREDARSAGITGSKQSEVFRSVEDSLAHAANMDSKLLIVRRVIEQYPDSKMALATLSGRFSAGMAKSYSEHLPEIFKLYDLLSPSIRASNAGQAYDKALVDVSHIVVGGTLSDFTSKTADGKIVKLSDLRGKYVLVDFWASWCIPCRAEFPFLKKAYARFKSKDFEILGYSIDNDKSLWVSAMENDDVPWMNVSNLIGPRDPIALTYQVNAVPSNFLIGPDGKVIAINLRGELVEPTLAKFIK